MQRKRTKRTRGTIYLVSCVSQKRSVSAVARDLYLSDWFKKARGYVEAAGNPWFILSAEYGLLRPEAVAEPYDKTLNTMGVGARRVWAKGVQEQLRRQVGTADRIVVLAGARYREFLMPALHAMSRVVEVPMEGLRIGEQLRWLSSHEPT